MINLTTAAAACKKFVWVLSLILLIGFLIFLMFYRFSPKTLPREIPKPIEKPAFETFPGEASQFITDRLSTPTNIPKTLPIYRLTLRESLLPNANFFASKLGFRNPPKELNDVTFGQGLLFSKEDGALSVYQDIISYQEFITEPQIGQFDETRLKIKALEFISGLGILTTNINLQSEPTVTYQKLAGEGFAPTKDPNLANFVNFIFNYTLEGLKVVGNISDLRITLTPAGDVVRLTFRSFGAEAETDGYLLMEFQDALKLLLNNQGSLIKVSGEQEDVEVSRNFGRVSLNNTYLAYYLSTKQPDTIQPIWVFEGESIINSLPVNVTFAVPAIESKFLKAP
ncbi:hypothetical protein A3B52_03015 [Candidatus Curtissbacteria bacterium RIFCSPLOWO2_01_FULL_41_28]|nr:MAG: hypothetical protein A3B52_03015 [Candidatus Curtissbacteria bacterium RIFCSPLOWO2_01_FULL_41_28]